MHYSDVICFWRWGGGGGGCNSVSLLVRGYLLLVEGLLLEVPLYSLVPSLVMAVACIFCLLTPFCRCALWFPGIPVSMSYCSQHQARAGHVL
jgi:hypothetical protein